MTYILKSSKQGFFLNSSTVIEFSNYYKSVKDFQRFQFDNKLLYTNFHQKFPFVWKLKDKSLTFFYRQRKSRVCYAMHFLMFWKLVIIFCQEFISEKDRKCSVGIFFGDKWLICWLSICYELIKFASFCRILQIY